MKIIILNMENNFWELMSILHIIVSNL